MSLGLPQVVASFGHNHELPTAVPLRVAANLVKLAEPTGDTVLLEREQTRSRLEVALQGARAGTGRIVSLEGEAGIGKTSAALDFVGAHRADSQVYAGGCEQLSTPEPLGPLRGIERDSRGRFSISGTSQLSTFEALLRLLTSSRDPGLLLIEDLHWADDPTLDLIRYLGRRIRTARLLVIVTFRSDEAPSHSGSARPSWRRGAVCKVAPVRRISLPHHRPRPLLEARSAFTAAEPHIGLLGQRVSE